MNYVTNQNNRAMLDLHKPTIHMTTWDHRGLSALVDSFRRLGREEQVDLLAEELDRAELVEPAAVTPDIVTMNSKVRFVDEDTGKERTMTLVYPGEENSAGGLISIVTPVGSSLIGLKVGDSIAWTTIDGRTKRLKVLDVSYQPEANGLDGAGTH